MSGYSGYAEWLARSRRQTLYEAARLTACAERLVRDDGDVDVGDALALIRLSSSVYHHARRDGVRQAVKAGATVGEVAIALGMSIADTRVLIGRIRERDRLLAEDSRAGFVRAFMKGSSPRRPGRTAG
ncbi:hypothetical protein [Streptomyces baarnensis]|uniref:hypothetical protein n=1 Tax=Streptomyces baarnensis TaxID=66872 RepID=UPI003081B0A0